MTHVRWLIALLAAGIAAGCTTTRPPVAYPGLVDTDTPREQLCLVREADHCFIGSVGERYITQYGVNPKTVLRWRNRPTTADAAMGPKPRSTTLTEAEETIIVEFRRRTLLPLAYRSMTCSDASRTASPSSPAARST